MVKKNNGLEIFLYVVWDGKIMVPSGI